MSVRRKPCSASLITLCCLIICSRNAAAFQVVQYNHCRPPSLGVSFSAPIHSRQIRQRRVIALHSTSKDDNDKEGAIETKSSSSPKTTSSFVGLPSYKRIFFFVASTVVIWVSEPLLSLVDSAAVGRYASSSSSSQSVIQLAALGPPTML